MPSASNPLQEARRFIRHKQFEDAINLLLTLLADDDASPAIHELLGSAYFLAGRNAEAAHHFERLTRLVTQPGRALINLGAVYNRNGEYEKAVEVIRRGLHYEKKSADGYYNLGVAYRRLNQLPLAIAAYREAIRIDSTFAEAYQNLGNVLLQQGQAESAAKEFRKALQYRPNFDRAKRGLAEAEQAIEAAKQGNSLLAKVEAARAQSNLEGGPRLLNEEERNRDRRQLHDLAAEIAVAAHSWLYLLRSELDKSLLHIEKQEALRQGDPFGALLDEFTTAGQKTEEGRRRLRRKVLELVAHEELQHAPK